MFRKTVSMTALASFAVLLLTSVVLYFEPHGRVAYWGDWRFLGLTKESWDQVHLTTGVLFLASIGLHVWLNWKPLLSAMRNRARQLRFTPPVVLALVLTLFVAVGTLLGLPPMKQVLDFSAWLKESHVATYGNPPYGHAELSTLADFTRAVGLDADACLAALEAEGIQARPDQTLLDIAEAADRSPKQIHEIMLATRPADADPFAAMPDLPPEGTGKLTLAQLAETYGLPLDRTMERLSMSGLPADADRTIKDLAQEAGKEPAEIYQIIRGAH